MENQMVSLPIDSEVKSNPQGVFGTFYNKFKIVEKITKGLFNTCKKDSKGKPIVYFITDGRGEELTKELSKQPSYDAANDRPIIACVEVEENSSTVIRVDGRNMQPIAIMPSTNADVSGAGNVGKIRELASKRKGTHIVRSNKGILTTQLFGTGIHSTLDYNAEKKNSNVDVQKVVQDDIPVGKRHDQAELDNGRGNFLENLRIETREENKEVEGEESNHLIFQIKKPNSDEVYNIEVFLKYLQNTIGANGLSLEETLSSTEHTVTDFNSQTKKAAEALEEWAQKFPVDELAFNSDGTPAESVAELLKKQAAFLGISIGDFLNIPYDEGAGWSYRLDISPDRKSLNISLANGTTKEVTALTSIPLETKQVNAEEFLTKLIFDENGKVKTTFRGASLVKWQIPWEDVKALAGQPTKKQYTEKQKRAVRQNFKEMYDANLFEVDASTTTFRQSIEEVKLQSPFRSTGEPVFNPPTRKPSNGDNASPQPPINTGPKPGVNKGGVNIDTSTGNGERGKTPPKTGSNVPQAIHQGLQILRNTTSVFKLMKGIFNGQEVSWYEHRETGEKYPRMTSLMYADEGAEGRGVKKPGSNNWMNPPSEKELKNTPIADGYEAAAPSTAIGNTIDAFLRDLFAVAKIDTAGLDSDGYTLSQEETIKKILDGIDYSKYPNTNNKNNNALRTFAEQMLRFKFAMERPSGLGNGKGLTFISEHLVIPGKLAMKGGGHTNVAGTIDLLAYDEQGNLYLFDFKTKRGAIQGDTDVNKWAMQLYGYSDLINDLVAPAGLKVAGRYVIPINVSYPVPIGERDGSGAGNTVFTTQTQAEGLNKEQLYTQPAGIAGHPKKFTGANPRFDSKRKGNGYKMSREIPGAISIDDSVQEDIALKIDRSKMGEVESAIHEGTFNVEGEEVAPPSTSESGFPSQETTQEDAVYEGPEAPAEQGTPPSAPESAVVVEQHETRVDPITGATITEDINLSNFVEDGSDFIGNPLELNPGEVPVISKYGWDSLTAEEQSILMRKKGYTKELWNSKSMLESAREKEIRCIRG